MGTGEVETWGENCEKNKEDFFQTPRIHRTVGEMAQKIMLVCKIAIAKRCVPKAVCIQQRALNSA